MYEHLTFSSTAACAQEDMWEVGEDIATCPSCTLIIRIIYDEEDLPPFRQVESDAEDEENDDDDDNEQTAKKVVGDQGDQVSAIAETVNQLAISAQ